MKPKLALRNFLALAGSSLLAISSANAANYYWDSNGSGASNAGLGNAAGTWGTSAFFRTIGAADARLVIDGTLASLASRAGTSSDTFYFGTVNLALGSTASTIGIDGTNVAANRIVFGAGQGFQGVTLSGGGGIITIAGASGAGEIVSNNTGTNTIGAELAGTLGLAVYGPGTVLLTGANTFTGGLIVRNGGTLQVGNGTSGSLTSQALTFNNGGGVFNVRSLNAGSTQAMGALTFSTTGAGDSTVQSTYGTSGNAVLSFTSLAARGAGATGNFVVSGGDASTNRIVLAGTTGGTFLDKGLFFGGSNYAATDTGGTLYARALIYGTDADTDAVDAITGIKHVKLTVSPASRIGDTLLSLNLAGSGVNYTMSSGSLTVPGILKSGGGTVSTISGGTSVTTASNAELVIRTDLSTDLLTISSAVTGFNGGLTKTGAGTLTLSNTNGYTGTTNINAGTLEVSGGDAIANTNTVNLANASGATFKLSSNETINVLSGGGFSGGTVNIQGNTLTIGATSTFGGQFSGTSNGAVTVSAGTLTLSNKNTFGGAINLNGTSQLTFTYGNDGSSSAIALSSGGAINMAGGTTLNLTPGSNLLVGTIGSQLTAPKGWTIGNAINITSGTANIKGSFNENGYIFSGAVTGSSTPATPTTLAIATVGGAGSSDRQAYTFTNVIADGSGGALGLTFAFNGTNGYASLVNSNTFSGPISVTTSVASPGYLVIGGTRTSAGGLTTGSGSLGSGNYTNTISLSANSVLDYASSANQTLGGVISGAGAILKEGSGTLTLSTSHSYTGITTISGGTLRVSTLADASSNSSLGAFAAAGAGGISLNGGTLQYTGATGVSVDRGFTLAATSTVDVNPASTALTLGASSLGAFTLNVTGGSGSSLGLGALTLTGNATLNPTSAPLTVASVSSAAAQNLTLGGISTGNSVTGAIATTTGTLTKSSTGTWTLSGTNSYSGTTTLTGGGTLILNYGTGGTDDTKLSNTAILNLNGGTLTLNGGTHEEVVSSTAMGGAGGHTTIALSGGRTAAINLGNITRSYSGSSAGATLSFAADNIGKTSTANNTAGILGGHVTVGSNWGINSSGSIVALASGSYTPFATSGGTSLINYQLTGDGALSGDLTTSTLRISNDDLSQTLDLGASRTLKLGLQASSIVGGLLYAGGNDDIYTITGTGTSRIQNANNNQETLFNIFTGTLNVEVLVGAGSGPVTKTGVGTLVLKTAANTYTGATYVNQGALRLENNLSTGTTAGGITVFNNAALELANNVAIGTEALTITGNGSGTNTGALRSVSTNTTSTGYAGAITIGNGGARINSDSTTAPLTLSGGITTSLFNDVTFGGAGATTVSTTAITGAGGLIKDGLGTTTLSATNDYTGGTLVSAGTLLVNGSLGNSAVTVSGGAFGGSGAIGATLNLASGSFSVVDLFDALQVAGTVTIYSGFGVDNLAGLNWGTVSAGTYTLIDGTLGAGVFDNLDHNSLAEAYDVGSGKSAYFQQGSLQLVVIPEPRAALLGGLGMLALLRRRRY